MSEKIYVEFNNPIYLLRNTQSMFIYSQYWSVVLKNLMNELLPQIYNTALNAYEASTTDYEYLLKRCNELNIEVELFKPQSQENDVEEELPKEFKYKTKPYKHQEECVKFGMSVERFLLGDEMGLGKALSLDTKVYTPDGFKPIIDIHKGDYVFTEKGEPCKVLAEYYNKNVNMYDIEFSDGSHIKCCEDHLWKISTNNKDYIVTDTKYIFNHLYNYFEKIYIPNIEFCVKLNEKNYSHLDENRYIVKIVPIEKSDAKCITVDNPTGLYVIENFIVTHNTKEIIDLATLKKFSLGYKHCLIICCVNGLKWNWQDEIGIHSEEKCHIIGSRINSKNKEVIKGKSSKLEDLNKIADGYFDDTYFFITNVETLRDKAISDKLAELCKNKIINMIAVDECHKCNSPKAQQTKGLLKLNTDSMIAMTGSPIMNNPLDLYVPLHWLGYERHRYDEFVNHFCRKGNFNSITGFKNMEQIQNSLKIMMLRRLKKDVLDLPEKIYTNEYVEMSSEQEKIYEEVLNDLREQVDLIARSNNPLANLIRLRQATGHTSIISSTVSCSAKFDRCLELVNDFVKDGHKIIIFSNWKQMIEILHIALLSYNPAVITGDTKDRQEEKRKFMEDDSCKLILGSIGACGTGLTLTAADIVIFYDEPWTTANKVQAEDRAHRIGAKNNVQIITLLTKNTIDERIHEIVERKGIISENLIDNLDCVQITKLLNFLIN